MNSVESVEPIETIEARIEHLEYLAGNYESKESLNKQVDELEQLVNGIYDSSKPLESLSTELTRQNLWQDIRDLDPEDKNAEAKDKEDKSEIKRSLVKSRADGLGGYIQSLEKVQDLSIPETKTSKNLAELQITDAKEKITEVSQISDELNIRSAQTSKEWLDKIVTESNSNWLDFEERMTRCENALRKIEVSAKQQQTRYDSRDKRSEEEDLS